MRNNGKRGGGGNEIIMMKKRACRSNTGESCVQGIVVKGREEQKMRPRPEDAAEGAEAPGCPGGISLSL